MIQVPMVAIIPSMVPLFPEPLTSRCVEKSTEHTSWIWLPPSYRWVNMIYPQSMQGTMLST